MESSEVQIFTLSRVQPQRLLLVIAILLCVFIVAVLGIIVLGLPRNIISYCTAAFLLSIFFFLILSSGKGNRVSQVLELYNDRVIIKGKDEATINFNEIQSYKKITTRVLLLKITLRDGKVVRILDELNGGLRSFISAFEEKTNKENWENKLTIIDNTAETDGKMLYVVIVVAIVFLIVLCFILKLFVIMQ